MSTGEHARGRDVRDLDAELRFMLGGHVAVLGADELAALAQLRETIGKVLDGAGADTAAGWPDDLKLTPVVLAAVLTMTDGRTVHVPDLPPAKPASGGVIHLDIPYPADVAPGAVTQVLIRAGTREFRQHIYPAANLHPGNTLHLAMDLDSMGVVL
jgi:hypothetical protein